MSARPSAGREQIALAAMLLRTVQHLHAPIFRVYAANPDGSCGCRNLCCASPGKHPIGKGWQAEATTDAKVLEHWRNWRGSWGARTGLGRLVVDIDGPEGEEALRDLQQAHGPLPPTVVGLTGRAGGGRHLWYACPGRDVRNRTHVIPGVDIRADGGYVVIPPSVHVSGTAYTWETAPWETNLALAPAWLLDLIDSAPAGRTRKAAPARELAIGTSAPANRDGDQAVAPPGRRDASVPPPAAEPPSARYARATLAKACAAIRMAPVNNRNQTINDEAHGVGRVVGAGGLDRNEAWLALRAACADLQAKAPAAHPLTDYEVEKTLVSALQAGIANPRRPEPLPAPEPEGPPPQTRVTPLEEPAARKLEPAPPARADATTNAQAERRKRSERADIVVSCEVGEVVDELAAAAAGHLDLYQRGGELVEVLVDAEGPRIQPIGRARALELASRSATWWKVGRDEKERTLPPGWAIEAWLARGRWDVPLLRGVADLPVLRPDGTWSPTSGYDEATGWWVAGPELPRVKAVEATARRALELLREAVCDFPFRQPPHELAAIAGIMTAVLRPAISGPAPLAVVSGHTPGTGKSLLVDLASTIAMGASAPRYALGRDDEEARKMITSLARSGARFVLLDNLSGMFGGAALDAALTSDTWTDRVMQTQTMVSLPLRVAWWATGNNVQVRGDLARRTLFIYLDSKVERPEERQAFRHADLLGWAQRERPRLAAAAMTVASAYLSAGAPPVDIPQNGGFAAWDRLVRRPLAWLTHTDCLTSREELRQEADPEVNAWRLVLLAWHNAYGTDSVTTASVVRDCTGHVIPERRDLADALSDLCSKDVTVHSARYKLRKYAGRSVDGLKLEQAGHNGRVGNFWRVVPGDS